MKKLIPLIILSYICFEMLIYSEQILNSVSLAFSIWKESIFPSLFPFFVLSELLINYGFVNIVSKFFGKLMRVLKVKKECAFIFVMSLISGIPSNAKYTKDLYLKGIINKYDASKILCSTHFSNPLFILGTVSIIFLNSKKIGLYILICQYLANIIIGLMFRNYSPNDSINNTVYLKKEPLSFGKALNQSIINSINTLLLILGTITMCLILVTIVSVNFNLGSFPNAILSGVIEMTIGSKAISLLMINTNIKAILIVMMLSFGGLSSHLQVISIISDTDIKYLPFFFARILHAIISALLLIIIL